MSGFIDELKRRNVFRVGIAYLVVGWLLLQVADIVIPALGIPEWSMKLILVMIALGFPIALLLAWAFEMTGDGIKLEKNVDRSQTVTSQTNRKIDFVIIGLLAVAVIYFAADKYLIEKESLEPVAGVSDSTKQINKHSVAVLPFANRGADDESGFFAEGIHDDLLTQLAKIAGLKVISRTSVLEYADTTKNMKQIGQELGVRNILEGGIQKAGKRVRINAQLIDADTDEHLWAETFDRELTTENIFEIQSEIALAITQAMQLQLAPETVKKIATAPTYNVEAYREYLTAMDIFNNVNDFRAHERAQVLFQKAVELDPDFALAWARLADSWQWTFWNDRNNEVAKAESLRTLQRARELDPNLPELHLVRAHQYYHLDLNYEKALEEYALAEQVMPGNAEIYNWRGYVYRRMDRMQDALSTWRKGLELDPRNLETVINVGTALERLRRWDEARDYWANAIASFPTQFRLRGQMAGLDATQFGNWQPMLKVWQRPDRPQFPIASLFAAGAAINVGEFELALELFEQAPEELVFTTFFALTDEFRIINLQMLKREDEAQALLPSLVERTEAAVAQFPSDPARMHALARAYGLAGRRDEAFVLGEQSLERAKEIFADNLFDLEGIRQAHGRWLCQSHEYAGAAREFRWLLSRDADNTLAGLVSGNPPCKEHFQLTDEYQQLEKEFGHLSNGKGTL